MGIEELARQTIDCGFRIHKKLGPGLLESVYEVILAASLEKLGLKAERQRPIPIVFEEITIVDEVKSLERLAPVHAKQLLTYVRLMEQPLGLLMNFGCGTFREGLKRVVNGPSAFVGSRVRPN